MQSIELVRLADNRRGGKWGDALGRRLIEKPLAGRLVNCYRPVDN